MTATMMDDDGGPRNSGVDDDDMRGGKRRGDHGGRGGRDAGRLMRKAYAGLPECKPYMDRFRVLKDMRTYIEPRWRDVRDHLLPFCGRFLDDDGENESELYLERMKKIRNGSPTKMALTAADGLHGGLSSPESPWFSYYIGSYADSKDESREVKDWTLAAERAVRDTLARSNFYTSIHPLYLEALGFGTAVMMILSDPVTAVRYYARTVGTYWLGQNDRKVVDTLYTKYSMRARDIVERYGAKASPDCVRDALSSGNPDRMFRIIQCIQPWNMFGDAGGRHPHWNYEDVRFVEGAQKEEKALYRGGYRTKPFVAVRWSDFGDTVYGRSCPGMDALPDIKQLQFITKNINMAREWGSNPTFAYNSATDIKGIRPGQVIKVAGDPRSVGLVSVVPTAAFNIADALQQCAEILERISAIMYNREILLVQSRRNGMTATEVMQLQQEKSAVMGPIVTRMGNEALMPALDRTFEVINDEWHMLPEAPADIQGMDINPYFTSDLARLQRQSAVIGSSQALNWITTVYSMYPDISLSVDWDKWLREFEESDLVLPAVIRSRDELEELKAEMARQREAEERQAMRQQQLDSLKTLGDTKVTPETAAGLAAGMGAEGGQ